MKAIHSCTSESFSGLEAYVLELVTGQYRAGHDVVLFCREGTRLEQEARARGVPLWTIKAGARPGVGLWKAVAAGWRARLAADECVLHMHAGGEPRYHLPALARRSGRLVKTILHFHIWINHRKRDLAHRALYSRIDEVWTSSESARAHLATLLPVSRDRIRVVPYGRDVKRLLACPREELRGRQRAALGLGADAVVGVCASRIEPIKGVRELFDAFVESAGRNPRAHLILIGGPSPENAEAEQLARELTQRHAKLDPAIGSRLHLPGFVQPLEPWLAAADFYVLPSYEECMSLAMLDAALLGLPIIGTSSGGTPSLVHPDETGWLVPPRDAAALASALDKIYRDPALGRRLGEGARALASAFDQEEIFRRIWEWYGARPPSKID